MHFKRSLSTLAVLLMSACGQLAIGQNQSSAQVVSVQDGDSLTVSHDGTKERVILYGIDCPEMAQDFGPIARKFTDDRCFRKQIKLEDHGKDSRGRLIAVVYLPDGTNLNQELVRQGLAWWSDKYAPQDASLKQLHMTAKKTHKGLWASEAAVPPWVFRNGEKSVKATIRPATQP